MKRIIQWELKGVVAEEEDGKAVAPLSFTQVIVIPESDFGKTFQEVTDGVVKNG